MDLAFLGKRIACHDNRSPDMLTMTRVAVRYLWLCGNVAALVGYAVFAGAAAPDGELVAQKAVATDGTFEEVFDDPELIGKTFASNLGQLAGKAGTTSLAALNKQLKTAKSYNVEIAPEPKETLPSETLYARARAGTVIIGAIPGADNPDRSEPVFASGFVVHKDGLIVSNAHVIEAFQGMKAVGAMTSDGRVFPFKAVLAADRVNDVALYKIDATNLTPLPVARSVPVGATIYCLSHPVMNIAGTEFGFFAFTHGIVSGRYRTKLTGETPVNVLTITADYAQGSSGGPILDQSGAVVGIICQTLAIGDEDGGNQMVWKFARPASSILAILKDTPPTPK
jgi:S1-C subfamily serine protease